MRHFLVIVLLLGAACWLFTRIDTKPLENAFSPTAPAVPAKSAPAPAPTSRPLNHDKSEAYYLALGMPDLNAGWDGPALAKIAKVLETIRAADPRDLPGARSAYGKAFFSKLRYTTQRFHLQSSEQKIASINAFTRALPVYGKAMDAGFECDMETALLIGLWFEMVAGFSEDQQFIQDLSLRRPRIARDLDGNLWEYRGTVIYLEGANRDTEHTVHSLLSIVAHPQALSTEARVLALSHISLHLPTLVRRLKFRGVLSTVTGHRDAERDAQVRALYDTLVVRLS